VPSDLFHQDQLLVIVNLLDGSKQRHGDLSISHSDCGTDIFWKAGSSVADAWKYKMGSDAAIQPDDPANLADIGTDLFTES